MRIKRMVQCLLWSYLLLCCFRLTAETQDPLTLFENKFFSLSQDQSLICTTSQTGYFSDSELLQVIHYYEDHNPSYPRAFAVSVLTDHQHSDHIEDKFEYLQQCQTTNQPALCMLEEYWGSKESALRALALFYDTKTIIKHGEDYDARRFTDDHLKVFEKSIRKIPVFLRKKISKAKPMHKLAERIEPFDNDLQGLILEAFRGDFDTSIWTDNTHPLTMVPGVGFRSQVIAQVYNGQFFFVYTVKAFDKGKDGRYYRDINLRYLVDFRIPIIVHEIAHTIDNFHFWDGKNELYYFLHYRKLSTDPEIVRIIRGARLALWPSKWFEAFEHLMEVSDGRYDGQIQEKMAELIAQYILIPERLSVSASEAYHWLKENVFNGLEYKGYDGCPNPVVEPLEWYEHAIAKKLGDY